jgi:hypothetical protein
MTMVRTQLATCVLAVIAGTSLAQAKPPPKKTPTQAQQIDALWRRIEQLEQTLNLVRQQTALLNGHDQALKAPFIVTDDEGRAIFEVMSSDTSGAALHFFSNRPDFHNVTIDRRGISFTIGDSNQAVARLGPTDSGGQLLLGGPSGNVSAGLFGYEGDASLQLISIASLSRRGLQLLNPKDGGTAAVFGTQTDGGGGFQLSDKSGTPILEAGSDYDGKGFIHAGPIFRCMNMAGPTAMAGAVPDCIRGKLE